MRSSTSVRFLALLCTLVAVGACKQQTRAPQPSAESPKAAEPPPQARPSLDAGPAPLAGVEQTVIVQVWFLDDERMKTGEEPMFVPVERSVPKDTPVKGALDALFAGPLEPEKGRGLRFVASGATGYEGLRVEGGTAHVRLVGGCNSAGSTATIANELKPTLKQFEEIEFVKIYDPSGKTEEPEGRTDSIPFCLEP